jgi:hypothetical protein
VNIFRLATRGELKKIYRQLSARRTLGKGRVTEVAALCLALGAALAQLAVLLSLLRFNLVL